MFRGIRGSGVWGLGLIKLRVEADDAVRLKGKGLLVCASSLGLKSLSGFRV